MNESDAILKTHMGNRDSVLFRVCLLFGHGGGGGVSSYNILNAFICQRNTKN